MAADTKIVIVAGQEFSVPASTEVEQIRQQLTAMGFADVASATVQKGKRTVGEVEYETLEFVKKAGTKGLGGEALAACLASAARTGVERGPRGPNREQRALLRRLTDGELTLGDALDAGDDLGAALDAYLRHVAWITNAQGEQLCRRLDPLPPVAAPAAPRGW